MDELDRLLSLSCHKYQFAVRDDVLEVLKDHSRNKVKWPPWQLCLMANDSCDNTISSGTVLCLHGGKIVSRSPHKLVLQIEIHIPWNYPKESPSVLLRAPDRLAWANNERLLYVSDQTLRTDEQMATILDTLDYVDSREFVRPLLNQQLHAAVRDNRMDILRELLHLGEQDAARKKCADKNQEQSQNNEYVEQYEFDDTSELRNKYSWHLSDGSIPTACFINNVDTDRKTALRVAVEYGRIEMVPVLLSYGGRLCIAEGYPLNDFVYSLLSEAQHSRCWQRHSMLLRDVLCAGCGTVAEELTTLSAIVAAVATAGDTDVLNTLLETGTMIPVGHALVAAATHNNVTMLQALIDANVDVNGTTQDARQLSAVARAAWYSCSEAMCCLIAAGADIHIKVPEGKDKEDYTTALHVAKTLEMLRLLIYAGADTEARNSRGLTALHMTSMSNVALVLLQAGACMEARSAEGDTVLHYALTIKKSTNFVSFLVQHRASLSAQDAHGNNALHKAIDCDNSSLSEAYLRIFITHAQPAMIAKLMGEVNNAGCTPHCLALSRTASPVIDLLLTVVDSVGVKISGYDGRTSLHLIQN